MLRTSINQGIRQISRNMSEIKCKRLEGRTAIVTASTDGIGFAIAKRLAQEGAKVMISSRKESNVKKAVEQLKSEGLSVSGVICHVGKKEDREALLKKTEQEFGGLDILVSNAGINPVATTLFETPEEVWDKIFDINVKSSFLLLKESLSLLRKSKSPSIIIISSVAAYKPFTVLSAYSISKTALLGLTQAAAATLASEGIRVNCIAPGIIKTKFSQLLYEGDTGDGTLSIIPMQKFGIPNDIAAVASFLASDDAGYVTGETILATGGMQCRL
ncbi:dehydrogenase/reductase SDR family member 4 isoform X2 [Ceratina calcarata]|uniref:Dehydrogenase/reductase SDR family member 4 isoform X1 n=1 Tax=Ceratina calcarata TaxID=156304 RepID=A0AAJ7IT60_9HYME|nr:dehydrogenase/reductase SDR family member 4 isoform X1 [Ceratina calcarata]XP_017876631.1 dehydrogenase/reductase SDR family member 4 isoform X2 [Ceratina calcarata]